jgi:hypothetical protein
MANELNDKKNPLSAVSYKVLYDAISKKIPELKVYQKYGDVFFANNLHSLCIEVVKELKPKLSNQFFTEMNIDETAIYKNKVTLNFQDKEQEHNDLQKLMDQMKELLETKEIYPSTNQLGEILTQERPKQDTRAFSVRLQNQVKQASFGKLEYNAFDSIGQKNILRHDNVKISYKVDSLMESIKQSLIRYIQSTSQMDDFIKEDIIHEIRSEGVIADEIYSFIKANRFAAVKRASAFLYLDYLTKNMTSEFMKNHKKAVKWLKRYTERYEQFEDLCTQFLKEIRFSPLDFLGETRDILNTFRNKDVYNFLPFVGILSQIMVATHNGDKNIEQYGISLKLNGEVQNAKVLEGQGKQSFLYHIEKINSLVNHGGEKDYFQNHREMANRFWYGTIHIVLLKYFLLHLEDETYDPSLVLMEDLDYIAGYSGSPKQEDVYKWYCKLAKTLLDNQYAIKQIQQQLDEVRKMLRLCLDPKLNQIQKNISTQTYKRRLTFLKSILAPKLFDPNRSSLLRNELDTHNYKYIILTKEILEDSLFSFEYEIEFSNTFLCSTQHQEKVQFKYEVGKQDETLAVMFLPYDTTTGSLEKQVVNFTKRCPDLKKVCIPFPTYDNDNFKTPVNRFIFLFTYKLLVYLFLAAYTKQIGDKGKHLFIAFWHYHVKKDKRKEYLSMDTYIRQFAKELEFLFGMNHNTGSQGFDFGFETKPYIVANTLYSMYANVPKKFILDVPIEIPKIAIVVITSMRSDDHKKSDQYRTGVFGEVYVVDSKGKASIFRRFGTFFDHDNETVYQQSDVLVGMVQTLYNEGYKHILYIAKTPYTTKFLDKKDDQKELYFMNQELIESLYVAKDMAVYPMHFTLTRAYEARLGRQNGKVALFVDDTSHIQRSLYEDHEGIIPILQLYSGNGLKGNEQRHVYNSLITYQTLNRLYNDDLLNNKIQLALIDPEGIKPNLIRALLLLHTSRFESNYNITIKVNPYSRLLGDDGIAKKSLLDITWGEKTYEMNMIAYFAYLHTKVFA